MKKSTLGYSWDDVSRTFNRYTADEVGKVFNDFVSTPHGNRRKFNYEKRPAPLKNAKTESDQQYHDRRLSETQPKAGPLTYAADVLSGVGMGADAVLGVNGLPPVYSTLKAAKSFANGDLFNGALWSIGPLSQLYRPVKAGIVSAYYNFPYRIRSSFNQPDKFYRVVGKDAILDANRSGIIRTSKNNYDPNVATYFQKGRLDESVPLNRDAYIIENSNGKQQFKTIVNNGTGAEYYNGSVYGPAFTPTTTTNGVTHNIGNAENFIYWEPKLGGRVYKRRLFGDNIQNSNWHGDAVDLTKNRLANGGFERLESAHNENVIDPSSVDLQSINPLLMKNADLPLVYSPAKRAELLSTDVHEVPSWAATGNPRHIGVSNSELGPVLYSDRPQQYLNKQATSDIAAHEFSHFVYTPPAIIPREFFTPVPGYGKYFTKANSAEVAARGTQLKNYFGMKEGERLTSKHLKYAAKHFVKDRGYDNGMTQFFQSIKDWDGTARWLTRNAPIYAAGGYFGASALNDNE